MLKKMMSALLAAVLILSSANLDRINKITALSSVDGNMIYGDLNGDNRVDVFDLTLMRRALVNPENMSIDTTITDVNGDGKFDTEDIRELQQFLLGERKQFSADKWTPPKKEDLVHNGEQIDDDTYNILINTAQLFGIDRYEIVWSYKPITYAYTNPGLYYCMRNGLAYGYGVQIAAGTDIDTLCPSMKNLAKASYKYSDYLCYRPLVADDNLANVLESYNIKKFADKTDTMFIGGINNLIEPEGITVGSDHYVWELESLNDANSFDFINWYLIPIDDDGQVLELNYPSDDYDTSVEPGATSQYWFTNEVLAADGMAPVGAILFKNFIFTAKQLGFNDFEIVYNNSETEPIYYSFIGTGADSADNLMQGCLQIVKTKDITSLIDLMKKCLEAADGDESYAEMLYNDMLNSEYNPLYYWTLTENVSATNIDTDGDISVFRYTSTDNYKRYVMIPLDENGNEDLRLYNS